MGRADKIIVSIVHERISVRADGGMAANGVHRVNEITRLRCLRYGMAQIRLAALGKNSG
jgi:hypothetical protein